MRWVLLVLHVSFSGPLNHLNLRGNTVILVFLVLQLSLSLSQSLSANASLTYLNLSENDIGDSVAASVDGESLSLTICVDRLRF